MKLFAPFIILLLTASCVKMPLESLTLGDAVFHEGQRMHELNLSLLDQMFDEKRERIDEFIRTEYTPKYIQEFQARIPEGTDLEAEFNAIISSIIPEINTRRDMMQSSLESQKAKLVNKLNQDYLAYKEASIELRRFIESGVRLNNEKKLALSQASTLSNNKIDFNKIGSEIDNFISQSGDISLNISTLNNTINSLLNN